MKPDGVERIKETFSFCSDWKFCFIIPSRVFSDFIVEPQIRSMETYKAIIDYSEDAKFVDTLKEIAEEEDEGMNLS